MIAEGEGKTPKIVWSFATEAPLIAIDYARETGQTVAADSSGGLYLLDRVGKVIAVSHGFHDLQRLAWSDVGNAGAVLVGENQLCRLGSKLQSRWTTTLPDDALNIDIDPWGHLIAVSRLDGLTCVYNWKRKRVAQFATSRPLNFLRFVTTETAIVGAAEYGLLCCHELSGSEMWSERVWSNVGDLSITGDGTTVLLAGFNHGIQVYDDSGSHLGTYMVEGTPQLVSCSFIPERIATATQERHVYWLDNDGEMLWATVAEEDVVCIICDPLGNGMICGLDSGHIYRISWED